jgi:hypothetical protein
LVTVGSLICVRLLEQLEQDSGTGFSRQFTTGGEASFDKPSTARF